MSLKKCIPLNKNLSFLSFVASDNLYEMGPGVIIYLYSTLQRRLGRTAFIPLREMSVFSVSFFHIRFVYIYAQ